jgi:hypothetical protein
MKDIDFLSGFCSWKFSNKLQKLGLVGKISSALNVFTLSNSDMFNSENVKNKECVHTWAHN